MQKILKYKKLMLAGFLPLLFWGGVFVFWFFNPSQNSTAQPIVVSKTQNKTNGLLNISQLASANAIIDSDSDGLSDWEEGIYGTDPKNADSDGDGFLDGEEIASGRDPLKKGPDDLLVSKNQSAINTGQTATEKLIKLSMTSSFEALGDNNTSTMNAEQLTQILTQSLSDPESSEKFREILKSELYYFVPPISDIKISKDDSEKNKNKYFAKISELLNKAAQNAPPYDFLQIINQSMKTNDHQKLDEVIVYYKITYNNFKDVVAPPSLAKQHKNMATIFYKHWKIAEAIKKYKEDPALTLLALNELVSLINNYEK